MHSLSGIGVTPSADSLLFVLPRDLPQNKAYSQVCSKLSRNEQCLFLMSQGHRAQRPQIMYDSRGQAKLLETQRQNRMDQTDCPSVYSTYYHSNLNMSLFIVELLLKLSMIRQLFVMTKQAVQCLDYDPNNRLYQAKQIRPCLRNYGHYSWLYEINIWGVIAKSFKVS